MRLLAASLLLATAFNCVFAQSTGPENVLVVVNASSPDSVSIGEYYGRKRSVPEANIFRIKTTEKQTISRDLFDREIRDSIAQYLLGQGLVDQILYIVTTKGVPLYISGDEGSMGDAASVDSELTLLYRYLVYGEQSRFGRTDNPYFAAGLPTHKYPPFRREQQEIYLVTRLTARSTVDALFLVDRALEAADNEVFAVDLPSGRPSMLGVWIAEATEMLRSRQKAVEVDSTTRLLKTEQRLSGYLSLHEFEEADSVPELNWAPGAVALLLAEPFEVDGVSGELIRQGATAVVSHLGDPGKDGPSRPQILFSALLLGHNLAESVYLATRYLSWRQVAVGDPLSQPFGMPKADIPEISETVLDAATDLPAHFAKRRLTYLMQRYGTSEQAAQLVLKAEVWEGRGKTDRARDYLEQSIDLDPKLPEAYRLRGKILEEQSDYEGAYDSLKKYLELTRDEPSLHRKLAQLALDRLDDTKRAEPHARWLFAQNGLGDPEAVRLWAEIKRKGGDLKEAEALYFRYIDGQKEPAAFALRALGEISLEQGNLEAADDFLSRALGSASEDSEYLEQLLVEIDQRRLNNEASVSLSGNTQDPVQVNRPAQVLHRIQPEYPASAVQQGLQGRVLFRVLIDEQGQLLKIRPLSGERALVKAAEKAVRQWTFAPKLVRGRAEFSELTVAIEFKIERN